MLNKEKLAELDVHLQKILALPITRCSYRQIQNLLFEVANRNQGETIKLMDSIINRSIKMNTDAKSEEAIKDIIERFGASIATAKEVHDRGEFIALLSSDLLMQQGQILFSNFIKRIDGKEFQFLSDPESLFNILEHFVGRLEELKRNDESGEYAKHYRKRMEAFTSRLSALNKEFHDSST